MKIEIVLDPKIKQRVVKIYTDEIDEDIMNIEKYIRGKSSSKIVAYHEDEVILLDVSKVYRIFSLDKRTVIRTEKEEFFSRMSLAELEAKLPSDFIKISRSETINLDHVKNLDLSLKGTIEVVMKNGDTTYLSRRRIGEFKKSLGI